MEEKDKLEGGKYEGDGNAREAFKDDIADDEQTKGGDDIPLLVVGRGTAARDSTVPEEELERAERNPLHEKREQGLHKEEEERRGGGGARGTEGKQGQDSLQEDGAMGDFDDDFVRRMSQTWQV